MHFRRFVNAYYLDLSVNKHLFEMKQQTFCIMQSNMTIDRNGQKQPYIKQRRTILRPTNAEYCLHVFCIPLICFKLSFYNQNVKQFESRSGPMFLSALCRNGLQKLSSATAKDATAR